MRRVTRGQVVRATPMAIAAGAAVAWGVRWYRRRQVRRGRAAFHQGQLDAAAAPGATGPRDVRLWGRSPVAGRHTLELFEQGSGRALAPVDFDVPDDPAPGGTWAVGYPSDFAQAEPLRPGTRYRFSVQHAGAPAPQRGCFETAPAGPDETPGRFAIAVMSCHLPFDEHGAVSESACRLLEVLPEELERRGVKRVLMLGDQMYGDYPPRCSLFDAEYFASVAPPGRRTLLDCSREEVRRLYQERYRIFWKHPAFAELSSRFPCHLVLDDHEVVDNFGTAPEHSEARYANLRAGALDAFYDYQGARALPLQHGRRPEAFHQSLEYGTVAVFLMDLRSERRVCGDEIQVCSDAQWRALSEFLGAQRDKHVLFIGLSVPLLHVPDWLATAGMIMGDEGGDMADRWSNPKMASSRDRLIHLIHTHQRDNPRQRLVLLGGDVHVGAVSRFAWSDGARDTYQLIASALSNREGFVVRNLVELVPRIGAVVGHDGNADFQGELLQAGPEQAGGDAKPCNPYGKLNAGVIEVERRSAHESGVRLSLIGCSDDGPPRAQVVFDSGLL